VETRYFDRASRDRRSTQVPGRTRHSSAIGPRLPRSQTHELLKVVSSLMLWDAEGRLSTFVMKVL
jgi:hypothetical protein